MYSRDNSPSISRQQSARLRTDSPGANTEDKQHQYLQRGFMRNYSREELQRPRGGNASNESITGFHHDASFTKSTSFGSFPQLPNNNASHSTKPSSSTATTGNYGIGGGTSRAPSAANQKIRNESIPSTKGIGDGVMAGLEVTGSRPASSSVKKSRSNLSESASKSSLKKSSSIKHSDQISPRTSQTKKSSSKLSESSSGSQSLRNSIQSERPSGDIRGRPSKLKSGSTDLLSKTSKPHRLASLGSLSSISRHVSHSQLGALSLNDIKKDIATQSEVSAENPASEKEEYQRFHYSSHPTSGLKYILTPYQQEIYNVLHPTREERELPSYLPYRGPAFITCQAYRCQQFFDISLLSKVINKLVCTYRVLKTHFYRNDRIIDADPEGILDAQPWHHIQPMSYLEVVDPSQQAASVKIDDLKSLSAFVRKWNENITTSRPFSVLLIRSIFDSAERVNDNILVFSGSLLVTDDVSLTLISKDIIFLYKDCERLRNAGRSDIEIDATIDAYKPMEAETFADYAFDCKRTKLDVAFWKDQCVEVTQESVDDFEKRDLESQLRRIDKEKENLTGTVKSLSKRKQELESELKTLRMQRKQIGRGENGEGVISTFVDGTTGEVIYITQEAKAALIKTVLGEEAGSNNVTQLLDKHEVPPEVQRKLQASVLSIEAFANLTEEQIEPLGLLTKDKRQILALSEYVRNRIKDCIQEQTKVKFALERRIAKLSRELETSTENLKSSQNLLESNDDLSMRLRGILRPPLVETKIQPLSLDSLANGPKTIIFGNDGFADVYEFVPIEVEDATLENVRRFRNSWNIAKRKKAMDGNISSDNESLLASDGSDYEHEEPIGEESAASSRKTSFDQSTIDKSPALTSSHERRRHKTKSIDMVCLAAFAVLLKHISGNEKFLIGVTQSYRRNGAQIGPMTDTVPVKLDLSKKGLTFDALFGQLMKSLKHIKRYGGACPLSFIARNNNMASDLDVRFEFHSVSDSREWHRRGLYPEDLLHLNQQTFFQKEGFPTERLWSVNEQDSYDLKLILVETSDGLKGGIRYRKTRFESDKALKWAVKLGALFESIDYNPRKIKISSMISRFYNDVWQGSNCNLINGSSMSLYSSRGSNLDLGSS